MPDSTSDAIQAVSETNPPWMTLGKHAVRFEPPDVLVFRAHGEITVGDVEAFVEFIGKLSKPKGGFYYLSNLTHFTHQSPQAAARLRDLPEGTITTVAVVGASFGHRVLIEMMMRTSRIVGYELTAEIPHFLKTEDEARAYFAQRRKSP